METDTDFSQGATSSMVTIGTGASAYLRLEWDGSQTDTSSYSFPGGTTTPIFRSVGPSNSNELASGTENEDLETLESLVVTA